MWHFYARSIYAILYTLYLYIYSLHTPPISPHQHGMLVNRPSAFIFQQIILPHLASYSRVKHSTPTLQQQRYFSSSSTLTRPYELGQSSQQRANSWEPYSPPIANSSRRQTKEYVGLQPDDRPSTSSGTKVEGDEQESYRRTTALALERIIQSHQVVEDRDTSRRDLSRVDKGKRKEDERSRGKVDELNSEGELGMVQGIPGPAQETLHDKFDRREGGGVKGKATEVNSEAELEMLRDGGTTNQSRQAIQDPTRHQISQTTSTTASTTTPTTHPFPPLIHRLLQANQFRLTTLHILNLPLYALDQVLIDRVVAYMERHGGGKAARRLRRGPTPSPVERSLMSDPGHESEVKQRLPEGYWTILKSSRPPPRNLDDLSIYMPGIETTQTQKFTAFCNLQLAHSLSSTHSKGPIPPNAFPQPTASLKQLRALLSRITKLEQHRGFIPDRVTANIILSSLLRCSFQSPPSGMRIVKSKSGWKFSPRHTSSAQGQFGSKDLRGLFHTISKLIDRSVLGRDEGLSYTRHVKPFVKMLNRGFGELEDGKGLEMVRKWDKQVRSVLDERGMAESGGEGKDF
jgi:hypothetical protein